ncbi:MAG: glycosyltransferase [Euzebyales bacterium]|nr:glycosyltransferase [Euzebyales bacterium]
MKVYPRFSETFIVNEILAHEAAGQPLDLFSLRPPADPRFHPALAEVQAAVTYLGARVPRGAGVWEQLAAARAKLPDVDAHLDDLLREDVQDALQALELAALVRARGIRHLHAHFGSSATTVARLAAKVAGISYTFTAHAKDIFHESVDPTDLRRKLGDAQRAVTVSDFNLAHLRETYGPAAYRVERVYNGLDLGAFAYSSPADRPPVVVAVGRLIEKKGFADLLDAMALLSERGVHARCVIVGTGDEETRLRERAFALNLGGTVEFTGALHQRRVKELIASAAAFAAPCVIGADGNRDGLPTVLLEAMALGTPCVSTDVTGIPEVLVDGVTGLMVPQHDPATLAEALAQLLAAPDLRVRLAERGRAMIEADFDVRAQTSRLRELFAEAMATSQPEPAGAAVKLPAPVEVRA